MNYWVTGGTNNWTGYSNPNVDRLFAEQGRTMDTVKRRQITQEIERTLLTDAAGIPAGKMSYGVAWWPYVKGFNTFNHTYGPHLHFESVWLDK